MMDKETAAAILSRIERIEQENKLLKQWVARLKQEDEKLGRRLEPLEARRQEPTQEHREPDQRLAALERWQNRLLVSSIIGGLVLVATIYGTKTAFDQMRDTVSTKGLHILSDDGNVQITMGSTKEKGSWLSMRDTRDSFGVKLAGSRRLMMGVMPNGSPMFMMMRQSTPPGYLMYPGPMGISLGLSDEYPELILSSPVGDSGIYVGAPKSPMPMIEIMNAQGETVFKTP